MTYTENGFFMDDRTELELLDFFTVRTLRILLDENITTVVQLRSHPSVFYQKLPGVGVRQMREIRDFAEYWMKNLVVV